MARILLTGGAGFIGSHAYLALVEAGHDVVIFDNFSNARPDVPERLGRLTGTVPEVHRGDVLDPSALRRVFNLHSFDAVMHLAARKSVAESQTKPLEYAKTNIGGLISLLEVMRAAGVFRLVFSSTAGVYGEPSALPVAESAPTRPTDNYGRSKLAGEEMLRSLAAADPRWAIGILRYFNAAGAHASGLIGEQMRGTPANLFPVIGEVALGLRSCVEVFGSDYPTPDGTGLRDYVHVEDLAQGHVLSLAHLMDTGRGHVVNLGTGKGYSVLDILRSYSRVCGRELPRVVRPRRPGDIAACLADPTLAFDILGFRATRGLSEMCASSWNWLGAGAADFHAGMRDAV